eukprot:CAMPEP_0202436778 /NCGR_PEP_ID=MMETSP1345-20130828/26223_1 /ASSEMBLY_ACC=CAM_ASM_000843 /TAXON_ID=342563 /ORGANISM="Fabrea Fabrea salina" /LENGTH=635 /DNA_ID=CAMNT_0049050299 /DNA_START=243 /DNA_END=2150 /DNA_ORIENTATION=+
MSIALALVIFSANKIDEEVRLMVLFHTAGITSLTLLINGTSTKPLVDKLGIAKHSRVQENTIKQVCKVIHDETGKNIRELKSNKYLLFADWEKVDYLIGLKKFMKEVFQHTATGERARKNFREADTSGFLQQFFTEVVPTGRQEVKNEMRYRFLITLKGMYWYEYEKGQCAPMAALALIKSADTTIDEVGREIKDWELLESSLVHGWIISIFRKVKKWPVLGRLFTLVLYNKLSAAYDIGSTYLVCHAYAEEKLREIIEEDSVEFLEEIIRESNEQVELCKHFLTTNITEIFSEITRDIHTKKAAYVVLNRQLTIVNDFRKNGFIEENEFKLLSVKIEKMIYSLQVKSLYSKMPTLDEIIPNLPFFETIPKKALHNLIDNAKKTLIQAGEFLFKKGERAKGAYIILRGRAVETNEEGFTYEHEEGSIVGVQSLLTHINTNLTTSKAETVVYAAFLLKEYLPNLSENEEIRESLWRVSAPNLIKMNPRSFPSKFNILKYGRIQQFIELCDFKKYEYGAYLQISTGALLMRGSLSEVTNIQNTQVPTRSTYQALRFIDKKNPTPFIATGNPVTIVFHMCADLYYEWKSKHLPLSTAVDSVLEARHHAFSCDEESLFKDFHVFSHEDAIDLIQDSFEI